MKKSLILFFTLLLFVASFMNSCRKEEPRNMGSGNVIQDSPSHCFNHIMDEDETGFDCGGSCPACNTFDAPCTTTNNVFVANATTLNLTTTCFLNSNNEYVIKGVLGANYVEITFPNSVVWSGIFDIATGTAFFNEVGVNYYTNGWNHYGIGSGSVYVNTIGNQVNVELCNITVSGTEGFGNVSYTLTGKLSCN